MARTTMRAYLSSDQPAESGGALRFVASTSQVARDGMIIDAAGWKLDNYRKNPVFLWAHDFMGRNLPIGKAVRVEVVGDQLVAEVVFDQEDEFARAVERKYRAGYLNTVSVSWDNLSVQPGRQPGEAPRITGAELLEISGVPVPSDPDALVEREYRALKELFEPAADAAEEGPWADVAARMAQIYRPGPDDTDDTRERAYRALLPVYRRLGKTAPEFLRTDAVRALSEAEICGLFFEGEEEYLHGQNQQRAGAMLNQRNRGDLEEAVRLIQAVLERAAKEEAAGDDAPRSAEAPAAADDVLKLMALSARLRLEGK